MKQIISLLFLLIIFNNQAKSQEIEKNHNITRIDTLNAYSLYNINNNDYQAVDDYIDYSSENTKRKNRFGKTLMYTGILIGGIALADEANRHDYFINNSMVYGVGGILTILSTGLVISSLNGINKEIYYDR